MEIIASEALERVSGGGDAVGDQAQRDCDAGRVPAIVRAKIQRAGYANWGNACRQMLRNYRNTGIAEYNWD